MRHLLTTSGHFTLRISGVSSIACFVPDHDLQVLIEGGGEDHQPFHREPVQILVGERRHLRLIDPQSFGRDRLRQASAANYAVDRAGEPSFICRSSASTYPRSANTLPVPRVIVSSASIIVSGPWVAMAGLAILLRVLQTPLDGVDIDPRRLEPTG